MRPLSVRHKALLPTGLLLAALATLSACSNDPAPRAPLAIDTSSLASVVTEVRTLPQERLWDGVVEAVNQATLSAQTAGRVVELPYDVDDFVPADAVVVRFTDVEQRSAQRSASAQLAAAEAAAKEAEADFQRITEIYARRLVAKAELDRATARRDATRATLEAARAQLQAAAEQADYTVVRSPYSGIVTERHVQLGETVRPGQPLISGLSLGELRLQVSVPQSDVAAIREHAAAAVVLDGASGERIEATGVTVFPYADPATHSYRVRVDLPAQETGLHPGATVKVAFVIGEREQLLIPVSALIKRGEINAAYVLAEAGDGKATLQLRQLRLGQRIGDQVEVLSGLTSGERIALEPLQAAQLLVSARAGAQP
jgi:RND family efflux transporter MFP subunit